MRYEHLRTPGDDGGVLIEPAVAQLQAGWPGPIDSPDIQLLDCPLSQLRAGLRARLGLSGPVILTGHQAEFYHAGVLAKRMFTDAWQRSHGGAQVYLSVDSDTPKSDRIAALQIANSGPEPNPDREGGADAPAAAGSPARLRRTDIQLPHCDVRRPVEHQPLADPAEWRTFFTQLGRAACDASSTGLPVYQQAWLDAYSARRDLTGAFIAGNTAVERAIGLGEALQLRVSELSQTPEFRAFAAHVLLDAARFRAAYNAAQLAYRQRRGVRNPARPAPPLGLHRERTETPFWLVQPGRPRARLFVQRSGDELLLWADDELAGRERRDGFATAARHGEPWAAEANGWRLRPRALALSCFCRLVLCDLFVHGIGGAKYDEMTDDFCRAFFGRPPGPMACVTATLRLDLRCVAGPDPRQARTAVAEARRAVRDFQYNPQRYLQNAPTEVLAERERLIRQNDELRAAGGRNQRAARRDIYQRVRSLNRTLTAHQPATWQRLLAEVESADAIARRAEFAGDREYFYALHRLAGLQNLSRAFQQRVADTLKAGTTIRAGLSPAR